MTFIVIVNENVDPWEIIDAEFDTPPNDPVRYFDTTEHAVADVEEDLGEIGIVNETTGTPGTGHLVRI
ncbi:MAG TPA: hypothetical protein VJ844_12530 [Mucilaginibacter sp.]|nr:hypothetical protein [Mucilaginibacter sp.]